MIDCTRLRPRDLRRLIGEMWDDPRCDAIAPSAVAAAVAADRTSMDRALVMAWLRHLPVDHRAFPALARAVPIAAERRDWPWRARGRRFRLWDADAGPSALGGALLDAGDPAALLAEAGLDGDLASGPFVGDAMQSACEAVGAARGGEAERLGVRLVALVDAVRVGGIDAALAYALLNPWRTASPGETHRKAIGRVLVARIGDPRLNPARWSAVAADLAGMMPGRDADALVGVLRRWLTESTVRQFFKLVGRVTNDPKQWAAREDYWLGYLDAGVITDAWFAFGRQAGMVARAFEAEGGGEYGAIVGTGADPTHSALILSIGDIRIAEWSHNGACRFWATADPQAPPLYRKQYYGVQLRAMNGGAGFEERFAAIPHMGGWQSNFAHFVHHASGIRHPRWQEGYRSLRMTSAGWQS